MIDNLKAIGQHIFCIRDESPTEKLGLALPEWTIQNTKPNTGKILSVGSGITDKEVKKDKTAVFAQKIGFEILIDDTTITVLNYNQLLGVL